MVLPLRGGLVLAREGRDCKKTGGQGCLIEMAMVDFGNQGGKMSIMGNENKRSRNGAG